MDILWSAIGSLIGVAVARALGILKVKGFDYE